MNIADELQLAHEREIEDMRREQGALRHEVEVARGERDIAFEDIDDLSRKLAAKEGELQGVKAELGHALAQIEALK